ncbi:MAG: hypothetical protein QM582_16755, partial [Micropruina sp.]|uniref:hypothetical protein n=1 Tax=Micropruina sp. TaxID=2737536 RepID=UPI0039E4DB93
MKRLGVPIVDGDRELSHIDINWLEPERAKQISIDTRASLGEARVLEIFADVLADTDRRWTAFSRAYLPGELHTGTIEIEADGVGVPETMAVLGGAEDERAALAVMPEHYIVIGDIGTGPRGMEAFGLFGEPAYVHGVAASEIPAELREAADPAYPMKVCGEMLLKSDDTPLHLGALHQFRPTPTGFALKSTFFCPASAPAAIAEGHKLHFAIEVTNSIRAAYAAKQAGGGGGGGG